MQYFYDEPGRKIFAWRCIASITWSLDGSILYVVRMDGNIARLTVAPQLYRQTDRTWSRIGLGSVEKPYSIRDSFSVPTCVAVPQLPWPESLFQVRTSFLGAGQITYWCIP